MVSVTLHHHDAGLTWTESGVMARSAHAVQAGGRVWLIDPFDDEPALTAAAALGDAAGVIQLLDRHNRDCEALAARLAVPVMRLPESLDGTPFEPVPVLARRGWKEVALWWPAAQTLIVAEALGTAPAFALGRPLGVHPMLRLTPPRGTLGRHRPQRVLVGHGPPLEEGGADAVAEALDHALTDTPRLLLKLPALLLRRP
jgi:hypothetical protein